MARVDLEDRLTGLEFRKRLNNMFMELYTSVSDIALLPQQFEQLTGTVNALALFPAMYDGSVARSKNDKMNDILSVRDFGAKGDRGTDDLPAINKALAAAKLRHDQYNDELFFPVGNYRRTGAIKLNQFSTLRGVGIGSNLNNQGSPDNFAVLTNADPYGMVGMHVQDMAIFGGKYGIYMDAQAENADNLFVNLKMLLQSEANIYANKLLQTTLLIGGGMSSAKYGVKTDFWTTNVFNSFGTSYTSHGVSTFKLETTEGVLVVGGRIEGTGAGAVPGQATIDIFEAGQVLFLGVYFENTQEYLMKLRNAKSAVVLQSCHMTGQSIGLEPGVYFDLKGYRFDCLDNMVVFRDVDANYPTLLPPVSRLEGENLNLVPSHAVYDGHDYLGSVLVKSKPLPASKKVVLLRYKRPFANGGNNNLCKVVNEIDLSYAGITGTGFDQQIRRKLRHTVTSLSVNNLGSKLEVISDDTVNITCTLSVENVTAQTLDLVATFTDVDPATVLAGTFGYAARWHRIETIVADAIKVTAPIPAV